MRSASGDGRLIEQAPYAPGRAAYVMPEHVLNRRVARKMVLLDLDSERYFRLNEVGADMVTSSRSTPQGPRRGTDHNQVWTEITRHHGTGTHESPPADLQPLENDSVTADRDILIQHDRTGDVGPGIYSHSVRELRVVSDRGVVLDLGMVADPHAARHMGTAEDKTASSDRRVWTNDRSRMNDRNRQ
jgi:hypothetical protein